MKILLITHYFIPHMGGIENVVLNQATMLMKQGHTVTIVTSRLAGNKALEYHGKIKILRIAVNNFLGNKFGIPYPLFSPKLLSTLRQEIPQHDIIHAHGHVYLPSVLAALYARKYKKPFILTQHNIFIEYTQKIFCYIQTFADNTLGKFTLARATKIIAVSKESKNYVLSIMKKKAEVILSYNGVDVKRFKPAENKTALRKDLQLANKFICFTVRRITFKNGIDTLLQAANELKENKDILFLIAGRGPDSTKVQQFIEKNKLHNVKLLGFVSDEQLPKYFAASDLFILPSKTGEGFPLAILEAFASGIPVIATRSGGHVEVIEKDKTGYIVEPNDYKKIAKKISELFYNKNLIEKMSGIVRKLVVEKFSWEENVNQLITIYKSV